MNTDCKKNKVLGLVITDGVGYRNFILSTFLKEAGEQFKKIIILSGLPLEAFTEDIRQSYKIVELPIFVEGRWDWFFRKLKEVAHLQNHKDSPGIASNLASNRASGHSPRALMVKFIVAITQIFHSEGAIGFYERLQQRAFKKDPVVRVYGDILISNPVDILFFTHQRPPFIATLAYQARKLKIPTAAFIFSWDNLASKGRMAFSFDSYLVWSELMKNELLRFYTKVLAKAIYIVGTPQFEPYVLGDYFMDRDHFFDRFGLDPERRTVCYSCADQSIGGNDVLVITSIVASITAGKLKNCQLLVRTSPTEDESRFREIKAAYPQIKWNHPQWHQTRDGHPEPWSQRIPYKEDIKELKAVLQYCEIGVNMCSTMSLDFMIFGKPVVNTVFGNAQNGLYDDQRFLDYEHYVNVIESGAVRIAKNPAELEKHLITYLDDNKIDDLQRKNLLDMQVGVSLPQTARACAHALKLICEA